MDNYYLNSQTERNGEHHVHMAHCANLPSETNRVLLGSFRNFKDAVLDAKMKFENTNINMCEHCANAK